MKSLSIYIHWPFCAAKCPYCDFNSRVIPSGMEEGRWQSAYLNEIDFYARLLPKREIATIYFGGGTPSLMSPTLVAAILNKIAAVWTVQQNCEITLEANPSSSEMGRFQAFRDAGVNRLSLGVQALSDEGLRFLGRVHNKNAAREAIEMASKTFSRYSFDLIYGRHGQSPEAWDKELDEALGFGMKHLSLYQLTIEAGTVFAKRATREVLRASEEELIAMYELTQRKMVQAGLPAYEVSNHSVPGQESRHNLAYWKYEDYIGIGPGAHGRYSQGGFRIATANHALPSGWLEVVMSGGCGADFVEPVSKQTALQEALMMGLRLACGIDKLSWKKKFGQELDESLNQNGLKKLLDLGLVRNSTATFATTPAGFQLLDAVLAELLA